MWSQRVWEERYKHKIISRYIIEEKIEEFSKKPLRDPWFTSELVEIYEYQKDPPSLI